MYYVNEDIKNTKRIFPMQDRYQYYRLDMNENPEGLPKEFVDLVLREITPEFLSIYPEPDRFLDKYADHIGVKYENLLTTNGSDMAIRYLLETFGEKDKEVVTVSPSFEMYGVNCNILGLKHIPVLYEKNLSIDTGKILNSIGANTRVVVLLNPNNPIGNTYSERDLQKIINKSQEVGAVVIIDEAYHYFCENTFLKHALKERNVIILRTFSKLFSIAACRLGIIISNPTIINYVKKGRLTFDVNSIALLFAERIIERPDMIKELIEIEKNGKKYIINCLKKHGYKYHDGYGNFILIKPNRNPYIVEQELKDNKRILIHSYKNELLSDFIRVSVGSEKIMKIFFDAFLDIDK